MKFLEHAHIVHAAPKALVPACEDIFNGGIDSDVINMKNAKSAVFVITICAGTGSASVQILACDDATPTTTSAVSFNYKLIQAPDTQGATTETQTLVAGGDSDRIYVCEVDAAKLAELGYGYVQMQAIEKSNFPVDGAVTAFLLGLRSAEDQLATQVT